MATSNCFSFVGFQIWTDYVGMLIGITGLVAQYIKHKKGCFIRFMTAKLSTTASVAMGLLLITDLGKDLTGTLCI